jgi:hypothetical protein
MSKANLLERVSAGSPYAEREAIARYIRLERWMVWKKIGLSVERRPGQVAQACGALAHRNPGPWVQGDV